MLHVEVGIVAVVVVVAAFVAEQIGVVEMERLPGFDLAAFEVAYIDYYRSCATCSGTAATSEESAAEYCYSAAFAA